MTEEQLRIQGMLNTIYRKSEMLRKFINANPKYIYAGHNQMYHFIGVSNGEWNPITIDVFGDMYIYNTPVVRVNKSDHLDVGGFD